MAADYEYLLERARRSAKSFTFAELCELASGYFTFDRRRGSHHVFVREGYRPMVFQPRRRDPKMAKPYQVKQLVTVIDLLRER